MHIVISGMFLDQPSVGSGQYLHGLLAALPRTGPEHRYTVLVPAFRNAERRTLNAEQVAALMPGAERSAAPTRVQTVIEQSSTASEDETFSVRPSAFSVITTPFDARSPHLAKLWFEQVSVPLAAARLKADLLHVPYFAPPRFSPVPLVVTVLDIIPLRLPEYRGRAAVRAYMNLVARTARHARQVIAISDHSRGEIVATLGLPPERVTTTPLAAAQQYRPPDQAAAAEVAARYGLPQPFVYYVGGLDARKNVPLLIRAFAAMRRAGGPQTTLALAGRALGDDTRLFPDLDAVIATENVAQFVRRIDVPPADAPLLYGAATLFAFPSRYEGFGLPPLEAMACGTPVVAADASSLPEVLGDAALLVPPDDEPGWTAALWRVLADAELRADMRRRGLARAALFSYDNTARATLAVYEQVYGRVQGGQ
jgi:glycosyltransferase involved in cell wall biosynthesis